MNNLTEYNWILSVGTFLPLLGALAIMFGTSRDDEQTPKVIGIVTAGATLAIGIATLVAIVSLAVVYPALKASLIEPVDAMRHH